jgi:AraC-like DNA-binding protein
MNTVPIAGRRFGHLRDQRRARRAIEASEDRPTIATCAAAKARRGERVHGRLPARAHRIARRPPRHHPLGGRGAAEGDISRVRVESDPIYLRDGRVWTSGGETSGIDLALALIEDDLGLQVAKRTARVLVMYNRRVGGQSQFSAMLKMEPATDRLRRVLGFMREHLHEPLPVERLADSVHVGTRQLTRLFLKEVGETPAKAVERMRAEVAHTQLTCTSASIEVIARRVGLANGERMRRAFVKVYGDSPQAVRRTAARAP